MAKLILSFIFSLFIISSAYSTEKNFGQGHGHAHGHVSAIAQNETERQTQSPIKTPPTIDPNEPVFPIDEMLKEPIKQTDKFFSEFLNMLATLGLIIALILIAAWFLKRLVNTRIEQANTTSSIKILERRNLSPKSIVYLIEIEGTGYLVAESLNGITPISEFPISTESREESKSKFSKILDEKRPF